MPLLTRTPLELPAALLPFYASFVRAMGFRAQTSALAPAVELAWEVPAGLLPPAPIAPEESDLLGSEAAMPVLIVRRERRFPGLTRRGLVPLEGTPADLADGVVVYDSGALRVDLEETRVDRDGDTTVTTTRHLAYLGDPRDRTLVRSVRVETAPGSTRTTVRVIDRAALTPGTIYYYTAFVGRRRVFSRATQGSALATAPQAGSLFAMMPQIHRRLDTALPTPESVSIADRGKGQLQRFVEIFDAHAAELRGLVDGLRDLHAPRHTDSRMLPQLAHLLGWQLKDYLDEEGQRNEVRFASEVYRSVGALPNVAAMINRLTGWDTRVRELVRNVLMSFDASRVEVLPDGTRRYLDAGAPFHARPLPQGSIDTTDTDAMFRLRNKDFADTTAYSYDVGALQPDGTWLRDNDSWYSRDTIAVYLIPDDESQVFSVVETWDRARQMLAGFLPLQVRTVFIVDPGPTIEDPYDAPRRVIEEALDDAEAADEEASGGVAEDAADRIPEWRWLLSNRVGDRSVNVAAPDLSARTWHTGLSQGLT